MVTVSHYLSLTRGSMKVKLKTIIHFSLAIQSPVMMKSNVWLSTSTESVGSVSQKWFSIVWWGPGRCHQTGDTCPCHPPSQNTVLMWHNINITDPSLRFVILQIKAPSPSHLLDLSRVVTAECVIPLYFYLWTKRGQWGDLGRWKNFYLIGQIHAETDKLTDYYWATSASIFYRFCVDYLNCV